MRATKTLVRTATKGNAMLIVAIFIVAGTGLIFSFMKRSDQSLSLGDLIFDSKDAAYQMETALEIAENRLASAVENIVLNGTLTHAASDNGRSISTETFNGISNAYVDSSGRWAEGKVLASQFLEDAIEAQSFTQQGAQDSSHTFADFQTAFPTAWTDLNPADDEFFEVRYSFHPLPTRMTTNPARILFEYEYLIEVRAYGSKLYTEAESQLSGIISIPMQNMPFSQWATIVNALVNQNGSTLVFAGGNTSAQVQSFYNGPVHVNERANIYGHPIFNDLFSSGEAFSSWAFWDRTDYTGCKEKYGGSRPTCFVGGYQDNAPTVSFPNELFNTVRLAAGDTSANAATNTATVSEADLVSFLQHSNNGTLAGGTTTLPDGTWIAVDNTTNKLVQGGIFVRGDARVTMDVVQGEDLPASYLTNLEVGDDSCKFQHIQVNNLTASSTHDIYIGDNCNKTYVYDSSSPSTAPEVLSGRPNGVVYVDGGIDELASASRTRPAVAADFGFHISATKDVRIKGDLQYEDVEYYALDSSGRITGNPIAVPFGEINGSGASPTEHSLGARIASDSRTVLGISSVKRNVLIHINAPENLNLHMALFAGNSAAYNSSTGEGCGANTSSKRGCGWGVEGYDSVTGRGSMKILGSIAQFKSQTTGRLSSPPTGYESIYFYDTRLRSDLQPPGFPISNTFNAVPQLKRFKAWRLSRAN